MVSNMLPKGHEFGPEVWGPERTGSLVGEEGLKHGGILPNPEELQGAGISGRLDYSITLGPEESKTISFAIAGGARGYAFAREKATDLLVRNAESCGARRWRGRSGCWRALRSIEDSGTVYGPGLFAPEPLHGHAHYGGAGSRCGGCGGVAELCMVLRLRHVLQRKRAAW